MLEKEQGNKEGEDKGDGVALVPLVVLHFGFILQVGHITISLILVILILFFLFSFQLSMLVQLAGNRPCQGQLGSAGHLCQLFGTINWCVGLICFMKTVVVNFIKSILQSEDRGETVTPQDLTRDVRTSSLAGHSCNRNGRSAVTRTHSFPKSLIIFSYRQRSVCKKAHARKELDLTSYEVELRKQFYSV